jgi:hypothetical protein
MTASADPDPESPREGQGFLAPPPDSRPVDHCMRCGVETAPGVALCEDHNRGHLSGPSATQMHATIFGGIVLGVIGFLLLANLAVRSAGPFAATVMGASAAADGAVTLSLTVANEGASDSVADCRVTRDGVPRPDDLAFRTEVVPGGASVGLQRELAAPPEGSVGYDVESLTVICS